jgi:S1-C subfamily serine protease
MIKTLLFFMLACTPPANAHLEIDLSPEFDDSYTAELEPYAPPGLKKAYLSSVIVQIFNNGLPMGTGSGNYFRLGKHRFILTAAHVVHGEKEIMIIEKGFAMTEAVVVYSDVNTDIAIIVPKEKLKYTKSIRFRRDINNQVGEKVYHCGHPARESWHISEGLLTGTHTDTLVVNTFAWPGSSGSVLFDQTGRVLGIVSAIRIDGPFGFPQMVEHIVLAANIKTLDSHTLRSVLENGE